MTKHSKTCSTKHIERKPITLCEKTCLSVCRRRQCPTERGATRWAPETQKHRLGLCSTIKKKQILAECQARIYQHEFQAARAEEDQQRDQQLLQGLLLQQKLEFRDAHQRGLSEMEEWRKFQSSTFDTIARRRLVEDQDTILEFWPNTGIGKRNKLYEWFKGISECWISWQWKFPRYQSTSAIHTSSNSWRNAKSFFWSAEPQRRAAKYLGHTWYMGKRFCKSRCVIICTSSTIIASVEFINRRAAPFMHSGEKWKARTRSRSEMPVRTVSQKFSSLQWRRLFKELWSISTTTADVGSSFRQTPYTSYVCLLEDKIQTWGMFLFTIHLWNTVNGSKKWRWLIQWMIMIFVINTRYFNAEFWSTWCKDCFSAEQDHP